jgi:hypothetical protein
MRLGALKWDAVRPSYGAVKLSLVAKGKCVVSKIASVTYTSTTHIHAELAHKYYLIVAALHREEGESDIHFSY